jgi:hypothetical protein
MKSREELNSVIVEKIINNYSGDLVKVADELINLISSENESNLYKKAFLLLLEAVDNHYEDSEEFNILYCEAKELVEDK